MNIQDEFIEFDKKFKKKHPVWNWFDESWYKHIGKDLFGYAPHVLLSSPWRVLGAMKNRIVWAYQRVVRGYDERAVWGIGYWLGEYVPLILGDMKGSDYGIPMTFFHGDCDKNGKFPEGEEESAAKRYDDVIEDLILAFTDMKAMEDYKLDKNKSQAENLLEYETKTKNIKDRMKKLIYYYWEIGD